MFTTRSCLAAFAAALLLASGCKSENGGPGGSSGGGKRLIILTNGDSAYWDYVQRGMVDGAKDFDIGSKGYTAVMDRNSGDATGQLQKLTNYLAERDIAAVAISPVDAKNPAVIDAMKALQAKGIPVITIDSDVDRATYRDARKAFIGTDNLAAGVEAGKAAQGIRPDGAKYVCFVGKVGAQNALDRMGGFKTGAGQAFTELDRMADETQQDKALANVEQAMSNHPDLGMLVGIWSYNAPAISDKLKARQDREPQFQRPAVVAFDADPNAILALEQGRIDALVVQNPYSMGHEGVKLMAALASDDQTALGEMLPNLGKEGAADGDLFNTGLKVVAPDNTTLKADQFDPKTEFFTVAKFRAWLNERGLQGS